VDLQLDRLARTLAERKLGLEVTRTAREFLANQGYDPVYGARPLKRAIQRLLQNPIALELLEGHYQEGDVVLVDVGAGALKLSRVPRAAATGPAAERVSA
jgi:ATP-dependent Clp protease ATP-binding subunit ClpB